MKRRILFCLALLITAARLEVVQAQLLRIDSVQPRRAERGGRVVIRGSLGPAEQGKAIRLAPYVDHNVIFYYPTILRWTPDEAEVVIPRNLPIDIYLVTVVYPERPIRHSNNHFLTIREPAPPAIRGGGDDPVVVLPNYCIGHPRRRRSSANSNTESSTGTLNAPCETMRGIYEENDFRSFPGWEISIRGDFGNRRSDQHLALATPDGDRLTVSHLLRIIAWSTGRVRIRIGDQVRPGRYRLLILNRLSRNAVPGVFERGSNDIEIRIEN